MKKVFLFLFMAASIISFSQKKTAEIAKINCYLPTGEKCPPSKVGINMSETNKFFEPKKRTWFASVKGYGAFVVFKSLTKEPLYINAYDGKSYNPEEIKSFISKVDYSDYFGYYNTGLKYDIKKMINNKTLTDTFLIESFGSPTRTYESFINGKTVNVLEYQGYGLKIYLIDSIAVAYDSV